MKLLFWIPVVLTSILLASCGSGPAKRVSPPTASVQELTVRADGSWHLRIRLQNFSNVPMTFSRIDAELEADEHVLGSMSLPLSLDIPGESVDVLEADLAPTANSQLPTGSFSYRLHGTIISSDPKGNYPFERKSHLSPAPGLANTWR